MKEIQNDDLDILLKTYDIPKDLTSIIHEYYNVKCSNCNKKQMFCNICKIYECSCKIYFNCKTCNKQFKYSNFTLNNKMHKKCERCVTFNCYRCEIKMLGL